MSLGSQEHPPLGTRMRAGAANCFRNSWVRRGQGLRREISPYHSLSKGHCKADSLPSLQSVIEDEALGSKRMDHPAALCPRPGRKGPGDAGSSEPHPLPPAALPSARLARQSRFPRALREEPRGKKTRQGLNCTLLPTPRQFRARVQDPTHLVVSAGGTWEIITSKLLTLVRLSQSRAAPSRCSGRGFPAEHREQPAQPTLPGAARSKWICGLSS